MCNDWVSGRPASFHLYVWPRGLSPGLSGHNEWVDGQQASTCTPGRDTYLWPEEPPCYRLPRLTRPPPLQVAYCLAAVVRNCAAPLLEAMAQQLLPGPQQQQGGGAGPAVGLRKGLWELLVVWTEEAFILLPDIKVGRGGGCNEGAPTPGVGASLLGHFVPTYLFTYLVATGRFLFTDHGQMPLARIPQDTWPSLAASTYSPSLSAPSPLPHPVRQWLLLCPPARPPPPSAPPAAATTCGPWTRASMQRWPGGMTLRGSRWRDWVCKPSPLPLWPLVGGSKLMGPCRTSQGPAARSYLLHRGCQRNATVATDCVRHCTALYGTAGTRSPPRRCARSCTWPPTTSTMRHAKRWQRSWRWGAVGSNEGGVTAEGQHARFEKHGGGEQWGWGGVG